MRLNRDSLDRTFASVLNMNLASGVQTAVREESVVLIVGLDPW